MQTKTPEQVAAEAERLATELKQFSAELKGRPTPAQRQRFKKLRAQSKELSSTTTDLLMQEEALWVATGERLGRPAVDGDLITAEDESRAAEIVRIFSQEAGHC